MNVTELNDFRGRIARMTRRLEDKAGSGIGGVNSFPNGEVHRFRFEGVMPVEEFQDNLLSLYVWAWSMKDYLKAVAKGNGKDPSFIEAMVDSNLALQLIADIANRAKHGNLERSRSGQFATLSRVKFTVPQQSISSITFSAYDVVVSVSEPAQVEYTASVVSNSGANLGDAKGVLAKGIAVWEGQGVEYVSHA